MQRFFVPTLMLGLATGTAAMAAPATYELDPEHTGVLFEIEHIGYSGTFGLFLDVSGTFTYDMETQELSDVSVVIGSDSVQTFNAARDGHVKGGDFLNVTAYPEITFTADGGTPAGDTRGTVTGNLTILGETRPVTLDVTLNKAAAYPFGHKRFVLGLSLATEIQRSDFGMSYGVDNGLVGDTVSIQIETEAMRM